MTTVSVLDNYAGTFTNGSQSVDATGGLRFVASVDGWITALRWWHASGTSTPAQLRLWDTATQANIATVTPVPAPSGVGWQTAPLVAPIFVHGGREYRVAFHQGASTTNTTLTSTPVAGTPPAPLDVVTAGGGCGCVAAGDVYPNGAILNPPWAVDVVWSDVEPDTGALPTSATLSNTLDAWFTSDGTENAHQDALPWLTKLRADVTGGLADLWNSGLGDAAEGYFARMEALLDLAKDHVDALPDAIAYSVRSAHVRASPQRRGR